LSFLQTLVVFSLEGGRYALSLPAVQEAARAVEYTPLPKAPAIVLGVINVRGQIIPVLNIRRRFGLPEREIALSDHFLLARTSRRPVALAVDNVTGVLTRPIETIIAAEKILPEMEYVRSVVKLEDGLIFIHDLDTFLSLEEESALEEALPNSHQKGAPAID
jgi:purine-binding chemotaxis protein CheW